MRKILFDSSLYGQIYIYIKVQGPDMILADYLCMCSLDFVVLVATIYKWCVILD